MTTIAFKNGMFAADSQVTDRSTIVGYTQKIQQFNDVYYALAGRLCVQEKFEHFIKTGLFDEDFFKKEESSFDCLVINKVTKQVCRYSTGMIKELYTAPFFSIGSGSELALGAMEMGSTAYQAVQVACKWDAHTGGEVQLVHVWEK